jgi:hypothetical protein
MHDTFIKVFVWGIIVACALLCMVVLGVNPIYRAEFIQSAVDWYVNMAFIIFIVVMAFASLLKWS